MTKSSRFNDLDDGDTPLPSESMSQTGIPSAPTPEPQPPKDIKLTTHQERFRDEISHLEIEIKKATGNAIPDSLSFCIAKLKDLMGIPPHQAPSPEVKI